MDFGGHLLLPLPLAMVIFLRPLIPAAGSYAANARRYWFDRIPYQYNHKFFLYHSKPSSVADETVENIKARLDDVTSLTDEDIDNICKILKTLNK